MWKKRGKPYGRIGAINISLIKKIEVSDKQVTMILGIKTDGRKVYRLSSNSCASCSHQEAIERFFNPLKQILALEGSWAVLKESMIRDGYPTAFRQLVKSVKSAEENNKLILQATAKGMTGARIVKIQKANGTLETVGIFKGPTADPTTKRLLGQASILPYQKMDCQKQELK